MRNGHDAAVFCFIGCRSVGVCLGGNPGCPGAAVHEGVPGIVAGVIGLGPLLPTGGNGTLDAGVLLLDIVGQLGVHVVGTGGFRVKAELLVEFLKNIFDDGLFVLHGEHPDAEVLGLVLLTKLRAGKAQEGEGNLVAVLFVIFLGKLHCLVVKKGGVGHLDGGL